MADPIRSLFGKIQDLRRKLAGQRRRAEDAERALAAKDKIVADLRQRTWVAESSLRSLLERCSTEDAIIERDVYAVALRDLAKQHESDDLDDVVADAIRDATLQRAEIVRLALQGANALLVLDRLRGDVAPPEDPANPTP